ncbi:hypothetical protein RHSIM_Rhsim11G0183900 [Rhododendron simsii]|uniref:Uncharacterized protein n=1 Tax=Rhododendron simsii TaxID=118357 RepID=A0A834G656_RHOSS|nr:hypothetical protein RHSIM_Rhsim11G0183900 [Rhododendron simsii]
MTLEADGGGYGAWFLHRGSSLAANSVSLGNSVVRLIGEVPPEPEPKFNPFTGAGRRLDGKPLKYQPPPASSSGSKENGAA